MSNTILPMPVTIEQVAAVVRNMSRTERQRLLELVPDLLEKNNRPASAPTLPGAYATVEQLRQDLLAALGGQPLAADDLLLDDLTVSNYLALPDAARAELWNRWTTSESATWQEVDVDADALPA